MLSPARRYAANITPLWSGLVSVSVAPLRQFFAQLSAACTVKEFRPCASLAVLSSTHTNIADPGCWDALAVLAPPRGVEGVELDKARLHDMLESRT